MKIIALGATSSRNSINQKLASYAASLVEEAQVEVLDINDYEMPLFSEDREKEIGQPEEAKNFLRKIEAADGIVISFAEHNGSYTAAYKNLFDWASRIEQKVYQNKPALFLSTSPGAGGASSVLKSAEASAQFWGADLKGVFSVPSFYDNFDLEQGTLKNPKLQNELLNVIGGFK